MAVSLNKKVRNATKCEYNGIKFRSKLELFCYKELLKLDQSKLVYGIKYEQVKYVLFDKMESDIQLYEPDKDKNIVLKPVKLREITYTPDFEIIWKKDKNYYHITIECKGAPNEQYPLRKKLFLKYLDEHTPTSGDMKRKRLFMEPHNMKQVVQCISIIKNLN